MAGGGLLRRDADHAAGRPDQGRRRGRGRRDRVPAVVLHPAVAGFDPGVGRAAAAALGAAGFAPRLVVGDGLRGDPEGAPYDRLIATCAVRYVPLPWLHQVRVGGRILVALSGWSYANALALLPGDERPSRIDPATLDDWTGGWVAQLAAPSAERLGAGAEQILWDVSTGSQARTAALPGGGWSVVQRGPVRLWDRVEHAVRRWQESGAPEQEGFGITVSPAGQRVWLGTEDGPGWDLPI